MATVADILASRHAVYAWLFVIEGLGPMFTNRPELVGSGPGSYIGTAYGARSIKLGLVTPEQLSYGYAWAPTGELEEGGGTIQLLDFDGDVVDLFRSEEPDEDSDSIGVRVAPSDDPAPATVAGALGSSIVLWDRNIGIERIGPAGERRHFWCWPSDGPNGFDHPAGIGWPSVLVTDRPVDWAGRKCCLYMIVRDPDTLTWPSWQDQHDGGALCWQGKIRGHGAWHSVQHRGGSTRALDLHVSGPCSWTQGAINSTRPDKWIPVAPSVEISEANGNHLVACWMSDTSFDGLSDLGYVATIWDAQTFASGNTLVGVVTREDLDEVLSNITQTMITGVDTGGILASSNAVWDGSPAANWVTWAPDERDVLIEGGGTSISIRREPSFETAVYNLCLHASVWGAMGWDPLAQSGSAKRFTSIDDSWGGAAPVGGTHWGETAGASKAPTSGYYIGTFSTIGPPPSYEPDNGGSWREDTAAWPNGTVLLRSTGGDLVKLGYSETPCEGQLAQPPAVGTTIDGDQCDAAGWWVFRGKRLSVEAYEAGDEPEELIQVALCDWVATDDRLGIAVGSDGRSAIRVRKWESPRRFGIPHKRFTGTWASASGTLEVAPIAVLGGQLSGAPGRAYWIALQLLLSSGTAAPDPVTLVTQPGDQHPLDLHPSDKVAGDVEVRDLGLGLPLAAVDTASWRRAAGALPGGHAGALARSTPVLFGAAKADQILRELLVGRAWVPSWKRTAGEAVPKYGVIDTLAEFSILDVEVTLADASKAAAGLEDGWQPVIRLREAGPFDRFLVRVDRNPLDQSDTQHERAYASLDRNRRFRSGKIDFTVVEGGLRNPSPWIGQPQQSLYDWTEQARSRFGDKAGAHWSRPLWLYTTIVDATVAGSYWIGTIVRVVDPRAETPQGTRGLDHLGWVTEAKLFTNGKMAGAKQVTVALQSKPITARKYWAPCAYGFTWDAGTSKLKISEDYAGAKSKRPDHDDTNGFVRPAWASSLAAGAFKIKIYQSENGIDYPDAYTVTADVLAVDAELHTLTLDNVVGTIYRDMIKWVLGAPYTDQTAAWALALYMPITDAEGFYGPGLKGWRL
jgi:hypothetical protein